ncbi:hypothetical protein BDK51DRAFT_47015 [Blyttiomyces helicus]|uniref:Uncharacterized protein n=1 Tax=Blyttiomyces helicus TaxID=388810 RepID=A0A4P9W3J5_9FUNG|nr:hypothetical protein BDK51DRAFT_47015 [Blyttiomyces helicus]|eukprot:RKO86392.1 hypothetical protein BDK51DRAFT_47015 [Blyttiomyces helicus]
MSEAASDANTTVAQSEESSNEKKTNTTTNSNASTNSTIQEDPLSINPTSTKSTSFLDMTSSNAQEPTAPLSNMNLPDASGPIQDDTYPLPSADNGLVDDPTIAQGSEQEQDEDESSDTGADWGSYNQGAKFSSDSPTKEDVRTHDYIDVNHIDDNHERVHKFADPFPQADPNYLSPSLDLRSNWGTMLDQLDPGSGVSNGFAHGVRLFMYYNGCQEAGYPLDQDSGLTITDGYKSEFLYF